MAIRRACSYQATFTTPQPAADYSAILVTIQQDGVNLINKREDELTAEENSVTLYLTQEETAQLTAGQLAYIQIRCFESIYNAPGSAAFPVDVLPALNDTILGGV